MDRSRRNLLKTGAAGAALATAAVGYSGVLGKMSQGQWAGERPPSALHGKSLAPEFQVDAITGAITPNPDQRTAFTMCMGCTTFCGVRLRIDRQSGDVLRVAGNPYSPLSADPALPWETPVEEALHSLSRHGKRGLEGRSTACGRGAAVLEQMRSPHRVTQPLKRVGPRNGGEWQPISFEQLIEELVEGGDLFGEGHVDGLRAIRDLDTPIDPERPELGPRANQLAVIDAANDGGRAFAQRFSRLAFGSQNYAGHGSYCGGAYRSGSAAMFGHLRQMPHAKPDFRHAEFVLFIGTAPGNAGNPFKRQGRQIADARSDAGRNFEYVVIDPVLTHAGNKPSAHAGRWVPIKPGTDGAMAMALIRWILDNEREDQTYLAQPNPDAAEAAGEASWSNATHLVVQTPGDRRDGRMLRAADLGLGSDEQYVVLPDDGDEPVAHDRLTGPARRYFRGQVTTADGESLTVATSLTLLREAAEQHTLAEYSAICGIPEQTLIDLADTFTRHGKRAAANTHGGMMAGNGFYNAWAVVMLNTLIGNLNCKGGTVVAGGRYPEVAPGPRYNLVDFPGKVAPRGRHVSRNSQPLTDRPVEAPWFPVAPNLTVELFSSALGGYPYGLKALFLRNANPLYGIPGMAKHLEEKLRDPGRIPLLVSIDPFMNETSAYADYVVPDTFMYEAWGWAAPWAGVPTRVTTARWPAVESPNAHTAGGSPVCMESLFIGLAKAMDLPGFGDDAIPDADGRLHPLHRPEDYYVRAGANVAWADDPVPEVNDTELALSGVDHIRPVLEDCLKPEEWRRVAYVYARGGRYEDEARAFEGTKTRHRFGGPMHLYREEVGTASNGLMEERFPGTPTWYPARFADGSKVAEHYPEPEWPAQLISFKSPLQNSYSIAVKRLRQLHPDNPVLVHPEDAARWGLRNGQNVRITTPGGSETAIVQLRRGVQRGVIAVEHSFGHKELGARQHRIGNQAFGGERALAAGLNLNDLGLADPTRSGSSVWVDPVAGSTVRQGLPARITPA